MKFKNIVGSLVLLNFGCIFSASSSSGDVVVERPRAASTGLADQLWDLCYRNANSDALKLLAGSHTVEFAPADLSRVYGFLRTVSHSTLVDVLDGEENPGQVFVKKLILQVFPEHAGFWELVRMSKRSESRATAAAGLFGLMTKEETPVAVRKHAAEVFRGVRGDDFKEYLNDAQLEQVRVVLETALNDDAATYRDRYMAASRFLFAFSNDRTAMLGTEAQRKAAIAVVFDLAQRKDVPDEARAGFLMQVIIAPLCGPAGCDYLVPDDQRRSALKMILDSGCASFHDLRCLIRTRNADSALLATSEQKQQMIITILSNMRCGSIAKKVLAAEIILDWCDEFTATGERKEVVSAAVRKEALQVCYDLFDSHELTPDEKLFVFMTLAKSDDWDDGVRKEALKRAIETIKLPSQFPESKTCIISNMLWLRDKDNNFLASPDQKKDLVIYSLTLLEDLTIIDKPYLARTICGSDGVFGGRYLSDEQLQTLFPFLLSGDLSFGPERAQLMPFVFNYIKEDGSDFLASVAQRQQALAILARYMNDTSKKVAERKMDARVILYSVPGDVTDYEAHRIAATAVMALADE